MDDLKQQLDDALGAEDLVDQLTEKNLDLNEKLEEMRATVDDLEALKELADELEEDHVETEKQLEAEIGKHQRGKKKSMKRIVLIYFSSFQDHRDMLLREQWERLKSYEETSADYESTIQQFRELVALLQR
jgi:dynactin 1